MDSIRPLQNYNANIVPQAVLNATLGTVVYASNYNDLDNKPSINSVELRGNKTAEDLGLATPADITVTSVNTQTGDVSLTGQNIPYDNTYSVTEKINDIEAQIVDSGVSSVNGQTGVVILTGSDINYSVGVSLNNKIDAVEGEIPVVNYPVTSVNGETGAVVLAGSDIEYSEGVTLNDKIDAVEGEIPVVDYPVTSVNGETGAVVLAGSDIEYSEGVTVNSKIDTNATNVGDLSTLTTSDKSSLVGAINEIATYTPVYGNTASGAIATFDTSLALPLQNCEIAINAVQGLTACNLYVMGDNIFNISTITNSTRLVPTDGTTASSTASFISDYIAIKPTNIKVLFDYTSLDSQNERAWCFYDANKAFISSIVFDVTNRSQTITVPNGASYMRCTFDNGNTDIRITFDLTATTYEAYNGTTITINWSSLGTVTAGSLDVTTGKLTVTTGSMASGDYQITPLPINQISGTNNIFCNTGNTSVIYACSLKDYIEGQ